MLLSVRTDRDGKFQLLSLAESGFDPLARTCRFMLTEEAHHMFVGQTGVGRIIERCAQIMNEHPGDEPRKHGVIDLPTIQKKLNMHYTLSLDLFGGEVSTNAANAFNAGIKGRYHEHKIEDDHRLADATYPVTQIVDGAIARIDAPALTAVHMRLRDDYIKDASGGVKRWNMVIRKGAWHCSAASPPSC